MYVCQYVHSCVSLCKKHFQACLLRRVQWDLKSYGFSLGDTSNWDCLTFFVDFDLIFFFFTKTCCGYSKNCLNETVLLSTQNMFKRMDKKIIVILCCKILLNWPYALFKLSSVLCS